jgi:catechol 2,3-dioxygenase-like lactoylglutathione lyase family enzyme
LLSSGADHLLELIQYVAPTPAERPTAERRVLGAGHVALVVNDIQEACARVVAHGGALLNPPAQLAPGRVVCYLQDADGNWLELIQFGETPTAPPEAGR